MQERFRRLALVQAQRPPGEANGSSHPAREQLALGQRHRRRQGQDHPAQAARCIGIMAIGAARRSIGLHEGLQQHLGDKEPHQRAAREQRGHGRRLTGRQFLAILAQVTDKGSRGHRAAVATQAIGTGIETPGVMPGIAVPQVALGTGQTGVAFGAVAEIGQRLRLETDPGHRRPQEGTAAAAAP